MSQDPAGDWAERHAAAVLRAQEAMARVQANTDYADNVLIHLYLIRDRLATMETEAAALAERISRH